MLIKKIRLKNFKNFKDAELELGDMNVLVGANASGKSNFLQALKFLKDIQEHGLENAISLQGGMEYLRNVNCGEDEAVEIEVEFLMNEKKLVQAVSSFINKNDLSDVAPFKIDIGYLKFNSIKVYLKVFNDKVFEKLSLFTEIEIEEDFDISYAIEEIDGTEKNLTGKKHIFSLSNDFHNILFEEQNIHKDLYVNWENNKRIKLSPYELYPYRNSLAPFFSEVENLEQKSLLELDLIPENIFDYSLFDFDLKKIKEPNSIKGKVTLEENGENIALVIKKILSDEKKARQFSNLISDILPFIKSIETEKFYDKSLLFKIQEKGHTSPIPSSLLSDGTVSVTAILIALFFENNRLTIIEEPEYGIHPSLVSKLVDTFYEAAKNKQIIITTHSSEILKHIKLDDLRLISRDENGFSTVSKPAEKEMVKEFLKNELGINDLFVQNLLDI